MVALRIWAAAIGALSSRAAEAQAPVRTVRVFGTDYAFTAPDTVPRGRTAFMFANRGTHGHELVVARLRAGITVADVVAAARAGLPAPRLAEAYADGPPIGALFVAPGTAGEATLVTTLARGRTYVIVCTLHDTPADPQHAALGMFHILHVR
jgi:hypothetical protein